jgi:hypothetical protein
MIGVYHISGSLDLGDINDFKFSFRYSYSLLYIVLKSMMKGTFFFVIRILLQNQIKNFVTESNKEFCYRIKL